MSNEIAYTAEDVAKMLKISKNTVYELIKRGAINSYKVGRKIRFTRADVDNYVSSSKSVVAPPPLIPNENLGGRPHSLPGGKDFVICGQDLMLDVLSNFLEQHCPHTRALRAYIGSYSSLIALYQGSVQAASAHLWDADTGQYNIPYVKSLLPGIRTVVIHLTCRMQGFYVARGNPKNITAWEDLKRPGIILINREKGAGSRVLLDEHLRRLGIYGRSIDGYERETQSHLTVASTVGRGGADVAVGNEKIARQVDNVEFIPLQKERYDLVVKREEFDTPQVQAILEILRSQEFRMQFEGIGGYDTSEMGAIVAEW